MFITSTLNYCLLLGFAIIPVVIEDICHLNRRFLYISHHTNADGQAFVIALISDIHKEKQALPSGATIATLEPLLDEYEHWKKFDNAHSFENIAR